MTTKSKTQNAGNVLGKILDIFIYSTLESMKDENTPRYGEVNNKGVQWKSYRSIIEPSKNQKTASLVVVSTYIRSSLNTLIDKSDFIRAVNNGMKNAININPLKLDNGNDERLKKLYPSMQKAEINEFLDFLRAIAWMIARIAFFKDCSTSIDISKFASILHSFAVFDEVRTTGYIGYIDEVINAAEIKKKVKKPTEITLSKSDIQTSSHSSSQTVSSIQIDNESDQQSDNE